MDIANVSSPAEQRKAKQINIRLTEGQAIVLKQYCTRNGSTTNTAVLAALCAMIEGFERA